MASREIALAGVGFGSRSLALAGLVLRVSAIVWLGPDAPSVTVASANAPTIVVTAFDSAGIQLASTETKAVFVSAEDIATVTAATVSAPSVLAASASSPAIIVTVEATMGYPLQSDFFVTFTIKDPLTGALVNATTATFKTEDPAGSEATLSGGAINNYSTGLYRVTVRGTTPGSWYVLGTFVLADGRQWREERLFTVDTSKFI